MPTGSRLVSRADVFTNKYAPRSRYADVRIQLRPTFVIGVDEGPCIDDHWQLLSVSDGQRDHQLQYCK